MSRRSGETFPDDVRGLPLQVQVAVLYERVNSLSQEVRGTRRALWGFVFSVLGGAILFLFSVASGWLGPHTTANALRFLGL